MLATSYKYNAKYKPNQLICGTGQIAIVTGWTPIKTVAKFFETYEYAAIGQLYSPVRGLNFLVRNLLLNPHVRSLIVLNKTKEDRNSGACQCLIDLFIYGFQKGKSDLGKECWVVKSPTLGYIDIEVEESAISNLIKSITLTICSDFDGLKRAVKNKVPGKPSWGEPIEFPLIEQKQTILPGTRYGHRIEGKTIAETWVKIIQRIKTTGTIRPTGYDGQWQELIDLMAIVTDEPTEFYFPEPNYLPCDRQSVIDYIPQILDDAPYQEGVKYTYGQRLRSWFKKDQIEQVINKLISEIDAASAVMSLWDVEDHEKGGSPCLNHIWLRIVDNELSLTATFRSNDMFSAWPSNAMGLRALQGYICTEINNRTGWNIRLGPLITASQSAHIYSDCWENADLLIRNQYQKILGNRSYSDAVGNFVISWNDKLSVEQTTPKGEVVRYYSGSNPLKLAREIVGDNPGIDAEHAIYIGIELQKCLEQKEGYTQDK